MISIVKMGLALAFLRILVTPCSAIDSAEWVIFCSRLPSGRIGWDSTLVHTKALKVTKLGNGHIMQMLDDVLNRQGVEFEDEFAQWYRALEFSEPTTPNRYEVNTLLRDFSLWARRETRLWLTFTPVFRWNPSHPILFNDQLVTNSGESSARIGLRKRSQISVWEDFSRLVCSGIEKNIGMQIRNSGSVGTNTFWNRDLPKVISADVSLKVCLYLPDHCIIVYRCIGNVEGPLNESGAKSIKGFDPESTFRNYVMGIGNPLIIEIPAEETAPPKGDRSQTLHKR